MLMEANSLYVQGETYTLAKAQHAYKSLVKIHEKSGKYVYTVCLYTVTIDVVG